MHDLLRPSSRLEISLSSSPAPPAPRRNSTVRESHRESAGQPSWCGPTGLVCVCVCDVTFSIALFFDAVAARKNVNFSIEKVVPENVDRKSDFSTA